MCPELDQYPSSFLQYYISNDNEALLSSWLWRFLITIKSQTLYKERDAQFHYRPTPIINVTLCFLALDAQKTNKH